MAAEFDIARIVDLIAMERRRAADCDSRVISSERTSPDEAANLRTAAYWHRRTADLIEKAVPAARNWTGRGHRRND